MIGFPSRITRCVSQENNVLFPYNKSLFGHDGWILASFFFCLFMNLDSVSVHKHAKKKELGQYPAILTKQAWSIIHIYIIAIFHLMKFLLPSKWLVCAHVKNLFNLLPGSGTCAIAGGSSSGWSRDRGV